MSKSKLQQERALKHRQSDLREVWNRTNGAERMAFMMEIVAMSKPHTRDIGKGHNIGQDPKPLVKKCIKFARSLRN